MALAVAMVACQAATPKKTTQVAVGTALGDIEFVEGAASKTLTLTSHFKATNPRYGATSSDKGVATVSVSGAVLTVTPVAAGTANVLVTATATADDEEGQASQRFTVTVKGPTVETPNRSPVVANVIASQQMGRGTDRTFDLTGYFTDPDGDNLTYAVGTDDAAVATASVAGNMLTVEAVDVGDAEINVTAEDPDGATARQSFQVEVVVEGNTAPYRTSIIPDTYLRVEGTETLTLTNYFADGDADDLMFTAESRTMGVVTVAVDGPSLTITADGEGKTAIVVSADDGNSAEVARQSFMVTVKAKINAPPMPTAGVSTAVSVVKGSQAEFDLTSYFEDPENDTLTFPHVSSDDDMVATGVVNGSMLTIDGIDVGSTMITVRATDSMKNENLMDDEEVPNDLAEQKFNVTVTPVGNEAPTAVGTISPVTIDRFESDMAGDINLADHFTDPDRDPLMYEATSDDNMIAMAVVDDSTLKITAKAVGAATITVTASDSVNADRAKQMVKVTVIYSGRNEEPHPHPIASGVPAQTVRVGGDPEEIDLNAYFRDPDGDTIYYKLVEYGDNMMAAIEGSMLTITAVAVGDDQIIIDATDKKSLPVRERIYVDIKPVLNKPPMEVPGTSRDVVLMVEGVSKTIDLSRYFTDPENDPLTYGAESSNEDVATEMVVGSMLTITPHDVVGSATVTVTASDNMSNDGDANEDVSIVLTVTVSATPNEAPEVIGDGIPDQSLQLVVDEATMTESVTTMLDLADHFSDLDGPQPLEYSADSEMAMVAGSMLTITASVAGTTMITITASDGADQISDTFEVTVINPSMPSWPNHLPDQVFGHNDMTARELVLSEYVSRATMYDVRSSNPNVVEAEEDGGVLMLTPVGPGLAIVTVTPSNSGGSASSQTITVTVETTPVPTWIKPLQAMKFPSDEAPDPIDLSEYFLGATDYAAPVSNNEAAVTGTIVDGMLTLTPHMYGTAMVTITPSNRGGTGTAQTFSVTVQARPMLKSDAMLEDRRMEASTLSLVFVVSNEDMYFEDPDGSITKYVTTTDDAEKVAVYAGTPAPTGDALDDADMAEGDMVTLEAREVGTAMITVTATDNSGLSRDTTFLVTVIGTANQVPTLGDGGFALDAGLVSVSDTDRFKLGDAAKVVTPNNEPAEFETFFHDPDFDTDDGDELKFTVMYVTTGMGTVANGDLTLAESDKVAEPIATAVISPDVWNGNGREKFSITVTPVKRGDPHDILIVATDLSNKKAIRRIPVQVNRPPLAEGYVAPDAPAGTKPNKLRDYTTTTGISASQAEDTYTIDFDGTSDTDADGYFHDDDGDTLVCRAVPSVTGDTAPAVITMGNDNILTVAPEDAYETGFVAMTVTVDCRDGWGTGADEVIGEYSPSQSFTVSITSASVH